MEGNVVKDAEVSYEGRGRRGPERGPTDGSADRRLVICKKFISTLKKRTQEAWVPRDLGGREGGWGARMHGQALSAPSCPTQDWEGTGHRLTDSRTLSRINNFIYTLHTVCTALPLARGSGRIKEMGGGSSVQHSHPVPQRRGEKGEPEAGAPERASHRRPYLLLRGQGALREARRDLGLGGRWAGARMYIRQVEVALGWSSQERGRSEGVASVDLSPSGTLGCGTAGSRAALPRGDGRDPRPV